MIPTRTIPLDAAALVTNPFPPGCFDATARQVVQRCRQLATYSEEPGKTTRPFLSESTRAVHREVSAWMAAAGLSVRTDAAGNLRGRTQPDGPTWFIGSHLDTVPNAGAFDGVLGVAMGIAVAEMLREARPLPAIEVVAFSDEEGVRFGAPFIGSRAFVGTLDDGLLARTDADGVSVAEAIRRFGLDPAELPAARFAPPAKGYLEFHIEQGPELEALNLPIAVVEAIAGQTRADVVFTGAAGHAGTTPMLHRRDWRARRNGSSRSKRSRARPMD